MQDLSTILDPLISRVRTDVTAALGDKGMVWTKDKLTPPRITAHLNGGKARGVCPIKEGESTTMVALLDLDSHKGETSWADMAQVAQAVMNVAPLFGLEPMPWRSRGGRGIHLFFIWDEPQDAYSVRALLSKMLKELGYENGTGGVKNKQIEIFPKQDKVPVGGFGSQFILPLAGQSVPLEPLLGLEPLAREDALSVAWVSSKPVPIAERSEARRDTMSQGALSGSELARIVEHIEPNKSDDEYWRWLKVGMALHYETQGSADGLALWMSWSSKGHKYNEGTCVDKWESFRDDKEVVTTAGTLLVLAREGGYVEDVSKDFDDLVVPEGPRVEDRLPLPRFERDKQGILPSKNNLKLALERPDVCQWDIRFDTFRDEVVFSPVDAPTEWQPFADEHYFYLCVYLEKQGFKSIPLEAIRSAVHAVARLRKFDTAQIWMDMLPKWDGVSRVESFLKVYFGVEDSEYTRAVSRYMWTALAGRVLEPGVKADMVPIFEGAQGIRKSSLVAALVPSPVFFAEVSLHEDDANLARKMRGRLVAEISELGGLKTKEIEWIKAFTSRTHENWIPKYEEFATNFPRRLVFFGTTNDDEFLSDSTGNRRWLPVHVTGGDVDAVVRDRDQLWAEARVLFELVGVDWSAEKLAAEAHGKYTIEDPWLVPVRRWLMSSDREDGLLNKDVPGLKSSDILRHGLNMEPKSDRGYETKRLKAVMKTLGFISLKNNEHGRHWREIHL